MKTKEEKKKRRLKIEDKRRLFKIDKCKVHVQVQDKFKQRFLSSTSTSGSRQFTFGGKLTSSKKGSKRDSRQISFQDD